MGGTVRRSSGFVVGAHMARAATVALLAAVPFAATRAAEPPLMLAHEGFFYVNGKPTKVDGREYISGQMYVEERIPAAKTKPYPIVMVHGGTMSGTNFTGTPDGREGWAQYFVRQGYTVYVVDQVGRGRSGYLAAAYGPDRNVERSNSASRFVAEEKFNLWPQAHLHTQWPGTGEPNDAATMQLASGQIPAIANFQTQQVLNRDALVALIDRIGPAILLVHSQAGAFGWPVADARPDRVKAILAIEPNGPPVYGVEFVGAPEWFKDGPRALDYGITGVPLTYAPPLASAADLDIVAEEKPDGPGLLRCYAQRAPARQLPNLTMPILALTAEAS
jgi:pimeloyl-ACP methyl ester carboxylesterase